MARRPLGVVTLVLAAGCTAPVSTTTEPRPDDPFPGDMAKPAPPRPKVVLMPQFYWGFVTAVDKESITIQTPEWTSRPGRLGPDGKMVELPPKVIPAALPKRFPVSEELAAGAVPELVFVGGS